MSDLTDWQLLKRDFWMVFRQQIQTSSLILQIFKFETVLIVETVSEELFQNLTPQKST